MESRFARLAAATIALTAWLGLGVQIGATMAQTGSLGAALWVVFRFFTIIANLLAATVFTAIALGSRRAAAPKVLGGVTLALLLVGIIHVLLLRGLLELSGGALFADVLMHKVTPVLVPLFWLAFARKGGLARRDPWIWAMLPLAYFLYAMARAAIDGKYPYPFMDFAELGLARTTINAAAIAAGFVAAGHGLVSLDGRLSRRRVRSADNGLVERRLGTCVGPPEQP